MCLKGVVISGNFCEITQMFLLFGNAEPEPILVEMYFTIVPLLFMLV